MQGLKDKVAICTGAGRRNGLGVPAGVLDEIGRNLVKSLIPDGRPAREDITYRDPRKGEPTGASRELVRPGGWGYRGNAGARDEASWGRPTMSMTAADCVRCAGT